MKKNGELSNYEKVIENLFFKKYPKTDADKVTEILFPKTDYEASALAVGVKVENIPDITYTFRVRCPFPDSILKTGHWIIEPRGKGKYAFVKLQRSPFISLQEELTEIEIMNALPEIVEKYTADDEQGMLSSIRYNRLIDIFTKVTCFHLQSHIRAYNEGKGQVEIDELYVGIDQEGRKYIFPIEAKSPDQRDRLGWVQITNMVQYAKEVYPELICRPLGAKPIDKNNIYLIEFENISDVNTIRIKETRRYKLIRKNKSS
ncbi:MAG: hypothetical protein CVV30_11820 [Methanomicrobiales archaeon HGW-Methanomicrobiales-1]|jgi:hypothetical protein|nr:MAG: hypothetical protein CVV30_11820 [Methanomicrobiales archaeon HGW-Methanomicrobiales-1]